MLIFSSVNFQIEHIALAALNKINIAISGDKHRFDIYCTAVTDAWSITLPYMKYISSEYFCTELFNIAFHSYSKIYLYLLFTKMGWISSSLYVLVQHLDYDRNWRGCTVLLRHPISINSSPSSHGPCNACLYHVQETYTLKPCHLSLCF